MVTAADNIRPCLRCDKPQPAENYSPASGGRTHSWCKRCRADYERERRINPLLRKRHQDRYRADLRYRATQMLGLLRKRSRKYGVECDIDLDWMIEKLSGRCELTGLPFNLSARPKGNAEGRAFAPSVDQITPKGGYTKANSRMIVVALNFAMCNWGLGSVMQIARALLDRQDISRQ